MHNSLDIYTLNSMPLVMFGLIAIVWRYHLCKSWHCISGIQL